MSAGNLRFDVVGAEGPKRYFSSLTKATIAHAYLFAGPAGVGKKTFARRLAQSLLCRRGDPAVLGYDGDCASCATFDAPGGIAHPDFIEFDGALKIGDTDGGHAFYDGDELTSREIVRLFSLQAYSGGMRVLLLGDVQFASPSAANALLKFLEEAPQGSVTILTTPYPRGLLETIASRLIEVPFPRLSRIEVETVLRDRGYEPEVAARAARLGDGSVGRAIAAIARDEDSLRDTVARWFLDAAQGRSAPRTWASRETLAEGLDTVKALARDWIAGALAAHDDLPLAAADYAGEISALPRPLRERAREMLATLEEAVLAAQTNVPANLVAESVRMAVARAGEATESP